MAAVHFTKGGVVGVADVAGDLPLGVAHPGASSPGIADGLENSRADASREAFIKHSHGGDGIVSEFPNGVRGALR
jgi:hypothetical protein